MSIYDAAGFDFDLDEVWDPQKPHLRGAYHSRNGGSTGGLESSDSSRSSASGDSRRRRGRHQGRDGSGEHFRASSMHREAEVSLQYAMDFKLSKRLFLAT